MDSTSLVVVAIPAKDDHVWKVSSEKVPHLTLLYLGKQELGLEAALMAGFIEHAALTSLNRFGLSVDRRGELGEDRADVLFFEDYFAKELKRFRAYLMANDTINKFYHSVDQYPTWTPHLTLGYPESPAKPDDRDFGIDYVRFDRIALWTGDYEGFEIPLKDEYADSEMSMSDRVEEFLAHFGVKGMKWGVRKDGSRGAIRRTATKANTALGAGAKVVQEGEKKLIFLPQAARNRAASKTQARVLAEAAVINRSPQFKGKDLKGNTRLKNAYFKKVEEAAKTVYAEELNISRTEAWGEFLGVDTRAATNQMRISAAVDRIQHAEDDGREILLEMNFETDELGHIVKVNVPEKYLKHADGEGEDVLIHYGVKGMKWGVTRTKAQIESASEDATKAQQLKSRAKTSGTNALSNTELKVAIERMNLETQYSRLAEQTTKKTMGKKVAQALFGDLVKDVVRPEATRVGKAALQLKVEKGLRERGQGDLADRIKPKKK